MAGSGLKRWLELSPHLDRALEMEPEERAAWLARLQHEDPALADDLRILLEQRSALSLEGFLDGQAARLPGLPPLAGQGLGANSPVGPGSAPSPGLSRLGPYEVVSLLGVGGMAEVYAGRDRRLGRPVALKFITARLGDDETSRARLLREARVAAALNHPSICTIHEIGEIPPGETLVLPSGRSVGGGTPYIAMEFVEGRPLDALLRERSRLAVAEILRIGLAIAEGLAWAHARGIVHRDLKPGNVMVTAGGRAKILDFGIAKASSPASDQTLTSTPTAEQGLTLEGRVVGTVAYMSPEQAQGRLLDGRSDQFSFGALLYEVATSERPFQGETPAATLAKLLETEPEPIERKRDDLPAALAELIGRCLRKSPAERFADMDEIVLLLERLTIETASGAARSAVAASTRPAPPVATRRAAWRWVASTGLAAALGASALAVWLWTSRVPPLPPLRVEPLTALSGAEIWPTFSPDGQQVAFQWTGEGYGNWDIYLKMVGSTELRRLTTDPEDERYPAWSPDGRQIAFVRRPSAGPAAIHLVSPLGGSSRKVRDWPDGGPLSWSPDGRSLLAADSRRDGVARGTYLVPVDGGEPRLLIASQASVDDTAAAVSPDGRRLAYASCFSRIEPPPCDVFVVPLGPDLAAEGAPRRLTRQGHSIQRLAWAASGGTIVYDTLVGPQSFYTWRVDADGRGTPERLEVAGLGAETPAVAPSGHRLAFSRMSYDTDIHRFVKDGSEAPFLSSSFYEGSSRFSPDGRRVAFESMRSGERTEIWLAGADGTDPVQLTRTGRWVGSPCWSPDGRRIAFDARGEDGHWDIWTIDTEGSDARRLTRDAGDENVPRWSHDGRFVYFRAEGDGVSGIWRVPATGGAEERIIESGTRPGVEESADGQTLYYRKEGDESPLVAHPLRGGPERTLVPCVSGLHGFAMTEGALYYAGCSDGEAQVLRRLDLASGRESVLGRLERFNGYLTVSPDGRTILYTRRVRDSWDLMLIENFR